MPPLSDDQVREAIATLPGWKLGRGEIVKQYRFATFPEAVAFIVRLAEVADAANHHPDLENHYDRVRVALHTWSENGITEKDVSLAREIESVAEPPPHATPWPAWRPWDGPTPG